MPMLCAALLAAALADFCPSDFRHEYDLQLCSECEGDPPACVACYFDGKFEDGKCLHRCQVRDDPSYVADCAVCSRFDGTLCQECEGELVLSSDATQCLPEGTCAEPIANCVRCEKHGRCLECDGGYIAASTVCYRVCSGIPPAQTMYLAGCLSCAANGSCEMCDLHNYAWMAEYGGSCYPRECVDLDGRGGTVCNGRGTCLREEGEDGWVLHSCRCTDLSTDPDLKCACNSSMIERADGTCGLRNCSSMSPYCASCMLVGGVVECAECVQGYIHTARLCKQPIWKGCLVPSDRNEEDGGCETCADSYRLVDRMCEPVQKCQLSAMPSCAWCEGSRCTQCQSGWTNLAGGCDVRCPVGCRICDEAAPATCTECDAGMPGRCIPRCKRCDKGLCAYDGECLPVACGGPDTSVYGLFYGRSYAIVECTRHGVCTDKADMAAGHCQCADGYDPSTACYGCIQGYAKDARGNCAPRPSGCPQNCAQCDGSLCISCRPGFSSIVTGCNVPCAVKGCQICDPADASRCLACLVGHGSGPGLMNPPCYPACDRECDDPEPYCDYARNSTIGTACFSQECDGSYMGTYVECSNRGTCQGAGYDSLCLCDTGYAGQGCSDCAKGYVAVQTSSYSIECLREVAGCVPACQAHEMCYTSGSGASACASIYCLDSRLTICAGRGTCQKNGLCLCSDPRLVTELACSECKPGYVYFNSKCVKNDCLSGPNAVRGCKSCMIEGTIYCGECSDGALPTTENTCPSAARAGLSGGAIAGIVVAVLVVLALAGFLAYWFAFRKRPQTAATPQRTAYLAASL